MKNRFLLLVLSFSTLASNAQIEHSSSGRLTDRLGGMNRCEAADFDEYSFVEKQTSFNRAAPLKAGQSADLDHEIEALMFSEAAGASYQFSQCQRQLMNHLEKGLQGGGEVRSLALRRAAWLQFSYLRSKINQTRQEAESAKASASTIRTGMVSGEPGERTMWAMQETLGIESHQQKYQKAQDKISRLETHLRSLVSRIPLGNREEMKDLYMALAKKPGVISEKQFNAAFEKQIQILNGKALQQLEYWQGIVTPNQDGTLSARVDNDLKMALLESGQLEMVVGARGMSQRSQKEFMCRSQARYVAGPQTRNAVINVASMIGGYGLARLAVRAGLRAAMATTASAKLGARLVQVPALATWIGLDAAALTLDLEHARRVCFKPEFLAGVNERQCSLDNEFTGVFYEASAAECVTSGLIAAAPATMSVLGVLGSLPKTVRAVDGSMVTTNLPGVKKMIDLPNGGGRVTHFDSGITLTEREGLRVSEYPQGHKIRQTTERPGEFKETLYSDGRVTRENANGSRTEVGTDGSKVSYDNTGKVTSEVVGNRHIEDLKVRQSTADLVLRGLQRGGPDSQEALSNLEKLGFVRVKDSSPELVVFRNPRTKAKLTFKNTGRPKLTTAQSKKINDVLVQRRGEYVHPDAVAQTRAITKGSDDASDEVAQIRSAVGTKMDRPEIEAYVRDELKAMKASGAAERKLAKEKLIAKVQDWESVKNLKTRLLAQARQARYNRDVTKFQRRNLKANPDIAEADLLRLSQEAAIAKRARVSELRGMCTTIRPNVANMRAGALFAAYSGSLGAVMSGLSFGTATWDSDMSRTMWGARLGYEVISSFLFNLITARITAKPDSTFIQRVTQQNVLAFISNTVEAGVYQHFFNTKEDAQKELKRITSSPTFVADMNELIDHVNQKGVLEKIIDGLGDYSNNLIRLVSGREQINDMTVEDLRELKQEALKDPIVQEQLLDLIDDKMLIDGGVSTSNLGLDRLAYNTVYNIPSVPVNMVIGMVAFQAVCLNLDNPVTAVSAFLGITATRQFTNGYIFFESREKVLGTN